MVSRVRPPDRDGARAALQRLVEAEADQRLSEAARAINQALLVRFKGGALATLFYGSCLRTPATGPTDDRIYDFYVVVDDLRAANGSALGAWGNRVLPPNVFRVELASDAGTLRCKYGIVGLAQLRHAVSRDARDTYFWARLCQPTAVPFARGAAMRQEIVALLAEAVTTAAAATAPSFGRRFTSRELWQRVFAASYGRELRPESAEHVAALHDLQAPRFAIVTRFALDAAGFTVEQSDVGGFHLPGTPPPPRFSRARGKLLSALRLMKAPSPSMAAPTIWCGRSSATPAGGWRSRRGRDGTRCSAPHCWRGAGGDWAPSADRSSSHCVIPSVARDPGAAPGSLATLGMTGEV